MTTIVLGNAIPMTLAILPPRIACPNTIHCPVTASTITFHGPFGWANIKHSAGREYLLRMCILRKTTIIERGNMPTQQMVCPIKLLSYLLLSSPARSLGINPKYLPRKVAASAWTRNKRCLKPVNKFVRWVATQLVRHVLMLSTKRMLNANSCARLGELDLFG
mmetsp:Transcript_32819/g.79871  ORF Transcript_32819/g.79871 Transcript_32819/m.79871 type:complete len:163 (-) Transcript_32819:173-661(-)